VRPFVLTDTRTVSTAITVLQLTAPSTMVLELLSASATQTTSTTSLQSNIRILRKTATATVTSLTPLKIMAGGPAPSSTGGRTATVEGTDGDVLIDDGFNILNGWYWQPVPEERIWVPPSGIVALKFAAAPTSATWTTRLVFREIG
jgi:hypothetical protein